MPAHVMPWPQVPSVLGPVLAVLVGLIVLRVLLPPPGKLVTVTSWGWDVVRMVVRGVVVGMGMVDRVETMVRMVVVTMTTGRLVDGMVERVVMAERIEVVDRAVVGGM